MRTVSIGAAANAVGPACGCTAATVSGVPIAPAAIAVPPSFKKSLLSMASSYCGCRLPEDGCWLPEDGCRLPNLASGRIRQTIDEYHSPWLCTYEPRIHNRAVRGSSHVGMIGRRLSTVELRVIGVHVHLPFELRRPRNNSLCRF